MRGAYAGGSEWQESVEGWSAGGAGYFPAVGAGRGGVSAAAVSAGWGALAGLSGKNIGRSQPGPRGAERCLVEQGAAGGAFAGPFGLSRWRLIFVFSRLIGCF